MKSIILAGLLALTSSACVSNTQYGECIGVTDDKEAGLKYELSGWNLFLGIVFIETIIVPVFWLTDFAQCPVGKK